MTALRHFEVQLSSTPQRLGTDCTEEGSRALVEVPDRKLEQLDAQGSSPVNHHRRKKSASTAATRFVHNCDLVELNPTDCLR